MMDYTVRRAEMADFERISGIYAEARRFMREHGNASQWGNDRPSEEEVKTDICLGRLYVIADGAEICAVFELNSDGDECYRRIEGEWLSPLPYVAIHKVASSFRHRGMLHRIVQFAKGRRGHLKIDTHADNLVMQNALSKEGFSRRGIIHLADGSPRIAYEYFAGTGEGKGGRDGTEGA